MILRILHLIFFISIIFSQDKLSTSFLKDLNGKKVDILDVVKDGPAAISFWFLACEPCKKEMKYLDEYHTKYSENGFKVVSVNTDNSRTINRVKPFVNSKKYSFPVLSDPKSLFFRKLGGKICPYLVLVDHEGNIVNKHVGYNPGDEVKLEKEILELISKMKPDTASFDSTLINEPLENNLDLDTIKEIEVIEENNQ
tara:strand:+ start:274 stop:864 length:591 start_codon:yes stop_codon:yes gene_type:complete